MAGMLAAKVLLDHFETVTIVDRDSFSDTSEPRKGVPQSRHTHLLLLAGQRIIRTRFPELPSDLDKAGVPSLDLLSDFLIMSAGGWTPRVRSEFHVRPCSRSLLDLLVRRRLFADPRIRVVANHEVTGLNLDKTTGRVTGVTIRPKGGGDANGVKLTSLSADFVIETSGRASRAPAWLETLGFPSPETTVVTSFLGYSTRWYRMREPWTRDWKAILMAPKAPSQTRAGVLHPIEDGQWIATMAGIGKDYPPTDEEGFMEFARTLRSPLIYEAIRNAEPITPVHGHQRTDNRICHYERMRRWPERFAIMGDAACAFNPIYAQGMTAAALSSERLDEELRRSDANLSGVGRRFQKAVRKVAETPWVLATAEDFKWPGTEGPAPSSLSRALQRYVDAVLEMASYDEEALRAFISVMHMVEQPAHLLRPSLVARTLRWKLFDNAPERLEPPSAPL